MNLRFSASSIRFAIISASLVISSSCAQEDTHLKQSEAVLRNVLAVDSWISRYKMSRSSDAAPGFPRLRDLQQLLLEKGDIKSPAESPLVNPVSKKSEWPGETPHKIKDYRMLCEEREALVGRGSVEFIPFLEDGQVSGYVIRGGDPVSGKVLCISGTPFVKSSP